MKTGKNEADLYARFNDVIDWKSLPIADGIICGFSGGPDSLALLDLLDRLKDKYHFPLYAIHLNHGLRGKESEEDENFIKRFCDVRGINLITKSIKISIKKSGTDKPSLEMACREARFQFFESTAKKLGFKTIALGHTADDRIENLLLRLFRGAGGKGLGSMRLIAHQKELIIIRPLLEFFRTEILEYLEYRNLEYRIDSSNLDVNTDRNKIRNILLPEMVKLASELGWHNLKTSLARSASLLAEDEQFLTELAQNDEKGIIVSDKKQLIINSQNFINTPKPILKRIILRAFEKFNPQIRLEKEHIEAIADLITDANNSPIYIPGGLKVEKKGLLVSVQKPDKKEPKIPESVKFSLRDLPVEIKFGPYSMKLTVNKNKPDRTFTSVKSSFSKEIMLSLPHDCNLELRSFQKGDRIAPLGMKGHTRKLSDIFIDKKIPRTERALHPILVDNDNGIILSMLSLGIISEKAKVKRNDAFVLRIFIERPSSS